MKITKARKKLTAVLAALFLAALSAAMLGACAVYDAEQDIISDGYIHTVTYDANGGDFDSSPARRQETVTVRVGDNSLTVEPGYWPDGAGENDIVAMPERTGYEFLYWELVETDANGAETTREWNFLKDRVTSDITLRAVWERNIVLYISAIVDGVEMNFREITMEPGTNFISTFYSTAADGTYTLTPDTIKRAFLSLGSGNDVYTPLSFYWLDENGNKTPLTADNAVYPEDVREATIYAEVLKGAYTYVTQKNAATLTLSADSHWYLLEDIDLGHSYDSGALIKGTCWQALESFEGVIYGNGHTISNVWVKDVLSRSVTSFNRSIFGVMNGTVDDLTFENVEYTLAYSSAGIPLTGTFNVALLASSFGEGGAFTDVALENCTITIVNAQDVSGSALYSYKLAEENDCYFVNASAQSTVTGQVQIKEGVTDVFIS